MSKTGLKEARIRGCAHLMRPGWTDGSGTPVWAWRMTTRFLSYSRPADTPTPRTGSATGSDSVMLDAYFESRPAEAADAYNDATAEMVVWLDKIQQAVGWGTNPPLVNAGHIGLWALVMRLNLGRWAQSLCPALEVAG